MSNYSHNPFLHGTEKDSCTGPPQPGTGSYQSGLGHPSGPFGELCASLAHHSMTSSVQGRPATGNVPFNNGERDNARLPVKRLCHSADQAIYRSEVLSTNEATTSYPPFVGHCELQRNSLNLPPPAFMGGFVRAENVPPFHAAEDYNRSIPGLGDTDHKMHTSVQPPPSSQPKYTFEAASNILQQFGLGIDDLEPLLSFPEDQVTSANLPFILQKIRTCKEHATSSTDQSKPYSETSNEKGFDGVQSSRKHASMDKIALVHNQANKVIDYGHTSKYPDNCYSGDDRGKRKGEEDLFCYTEGKGNEKRHDPKLFYSHPEPYNEDRKCLPEQTVASVAPKRCDYRISTSETLKRVPSSSRPKSTIDAPRSFHPSRPDLIIITNENTSDKSSTNLSKMAPAGSQLTNIQTNQKTGMLTMKRRQPVLPQQIAQNVYKTVGLRPKPPPPLSSSPPSISERTFKGSHMVHKSLPTTAMMHDYAATTPKVFPHTCSLCYKEFVQMKEWAGHQNSTLHLEKCKLLRKEYPQWDGSITIALSSERNNPKSTTDKRSQGSHTSSKRQSPHRSGTRDKALELQRSRSRSRSPHTSRYIHRCHENLNSPPRLYGSSSPRRRYDKIYSATSGRHGCSSPRRSQERRYTPTRRHDSSSPRRSQDRRYTPARRHDSSSPRRSQDGRYLLARRHDSSSPRRSQERRYSPARRHDSPSPRRIQERRYSPARLHDSSSPRRSNEKWYFSARRHDSLSPRRSQERRYSPARLHGSSPPRRSQERRYSPARCHGSLSPRRIQVKRYSPAKRSSLERGAIQPAAGTSKNLKDPKKQVLYQKIQEKNPPLARHEPDAFLQSNKTSAQGMKKTAEKLAKTVLESSVLQSLPKQCDVEAVVKTLTPVLLKEWGKIMVSSAAKKKKLASSTTVTSSSVSSAKKMLIKKKPEVSCSEPGKITPPTMVKLCGIQSCMSHHDVLSALEHYGRTKSVLLIRSRQEAVVCFEKEEDARKVKTFEIKGCVVAVKPKETLKKLEIGKKRNLMKKRPAVSKHYPLKIAKSTPGHSKGHSSSLIKKRPISKRKCPSDAARVDALVSKAKSVLTGGTVTRRKVKVASTPQPLKDGTSETQTDVGEGQVTNISADQGGITQPENTLLPQSDLVSCEKTLPPEQSEKIEDCPDTIDETGFPKKDCVEEGMKVDATTANIQAEMAKESITETNVCADQGGITQIISSPFCSPTQSMASLEESMDVGQTECTSGTQSHKDQTKTPNESSIKLENSNKGEESCGKTDASAIIIDLTLDEPDPPLTNVAVEPKQAASVATPADHWKKPFNETSSRVTCKGTTKSTQPSKLVWSTVTPAQFTFRIEALADKVNLQTKLKDFVNRKLNHLLITNLPCDKLSKPIMNGFTSMLRNFLPEDWKLDFFFMMAVGVAVVPLPHGRFGHDIIHAAKKPFALRKMRLKILNSNLAQSPWTFYNTIMEILKKSTETDASRTVFFGNITNAERFNLQKTYNYSSSVKHIMPLYNKLFIEFSTLEDLDNHWPHLSTKSGNEVFRLWLDPDPTSASTKPSSTFDAELADTKSFNSSISEGSRGPFSVTLSSSPYLSPTARPFFITPEHKTIRNMADVESITESDCSNYRTIMLTNLPEGYNVHRTIKWRVQCQVKNLSEDYDIMVLPLQRRAFVHFDDWNSCYTCVRTFTQTPISFGKNVLRLHLVTQSMCPQYSEDTMYQSLMALSNIPVQNPESLSGRLVVVRVFSVLRNAICKLLDEVKSVGPFVNFLPLGNRIFIEMVNSKDVNQLVKCYKKIPTHLKHKMRLIGFFSCQDIQSNVNFNNKKQKDEITHEGSVGARLPPSDQEMEPTCSDVIVLESQCIQPAPLQASLSSMAGLTIPESLDTSAGATESNMSATVEDSKSDSATDVGSDVIAIDAQKNNVTSESGSTERVDDRSANAAISDPKSSTKTQDVLQKSCYPAMFFTIKAAIREHRLAKARLLESQNPGIPLTTDASLQETNEELQVEVFKAPDEMNDCNIKQADQLHSSFEFRETIKTNQPSTGLHGSLPEIEAVEAQLPENQLKVVGTCDSNTDRKMSSLQGQELASTIQEEAPYSGVQTDPCIILPSYVDTGKHPDGKDVHFEDFEVLDEFDDQMAKEMDFVDKEGRLEASCSKSSGGPSGKAHQEENDAYQIIGEGQEEGTLIKSADLALLSEGHSGKNWSAEKSSEDSENQFVLISTEERPSQDCAIQANLNLSDDNDGPPETFQILDSVDDLSENDDEPLDSADQSGDGNVAKYVSSEEEMEFEVIDCVDDQPITSVTAEMDNSSNWDSTTTMDEPNTPTTANKEETHTGVCEEMYHIIDSVEGDPIPVRRSETSRRRSSRRRGKEGPLCDQTAVIDQPDECNETSLRVLDSVAKKTATSKTRSIRSQSRSTSNETSKKETNTRGRITRSQSLVRDTRSVQSRNFTPSRSSPEIWDSVEGDLKYKTSGKGRRRQSKSQNKVDQRDAAVENVACKLLDHVDEDASSRPPSEESMYQVLDSVEGEDKTDADAHLEKEEEMFQILDSSKGEPPSQRLTESEVTAKNLALQHGEYRIIDDLEVPQEHHNSSDQTKMAKMETKKHEENTPMSSIEDTRLKESLKSSRKNECNEDLHDNVRQSESSTGLQVREVDIISNVATTSILEDVSEEEEDSFNDTLEEEGLKEHLSMVKTPLRVSKRISERSQTEAENLVKRRSNKRKSLSERENVFIDPSELVTVDEVTSDEIHEENTDNTLEEDYLAMVTLDEITEEEEEGTVVSELDSEEGKVDQTAKMSRSMKRKHNANKVSAEGKSETAGSEAKKPFAANLNFPAFTPNNPLGQEFVHPRSGFFCDLCSVFYVNERTAKEEHCSSKMHYDNLKNHYLKLQHMESKPSKESSPLSTPDFSC